MKCSFQNHTPLSSITKNLHLAKNQHQPKKKTPSFSLAIQLIRGDREKKTDLVVIRVDGRDASIRGSVDLVTPIVQFNTTFHFFCLSFNNHSVAVAVCVGEIRTVATGNSVGDSNNESWFYFLWSQCCRRGLCRRNKDSCYREECRFYFLLRRDHPSIHFVTVNFSPCSLLKLIN
jgi:hypothetical protein